MKIRHCRLLDSDPERVTHYRLRGRATYVFRVMSKILSQDAGMRPSLNKTDELVAKLYWPEQSQQSEVEILDDCCWAGRGERPHSRMIWSHKFQDSSTAKIRKAPVIDDAQGGNRFLYIIVFSKLQPIKELSGDEFLRAWWHAVVCHRTLWAHGVRHHDISPSNIMFYLDSDKRVISVLNDYDLSSLKDVPTGRERMGTIAFMAIELLTPKALMGKVERLYRHDAESFIWVLTLASVRYKDGKVQNKTRLLLTWRIFDAIECYKGKSAFLNLEHDDLQVSPSHQTNWNIARSCLHHVVSIAVAYPQPVLNDDVVFRDWLEAQIPPSVRD